MKTKSVRNVKRLSVDLDYGLHSKLKLLNTLTGKSMRFMAHAALSDYVNNKENIIVIQIENDSDNK